MQKEQYYIFNDKGIDIQIESLNNKIKWSEIQNVRESKRHITVFISSVNVVIIPKKVFSGSPEKLELLREIIKSNLPQLQ